MDVDFHGHPRHRAGRAVAQFEPDCVAFRAWRIARGAAPATAIRDARVMNEAFACLRIASPMRARAVRVLAVVLPLLVVGLPAWAGDLTVTVAGIRSASGTLMIGLYDSAEGFGVAVKHATEAGLLTDRGRLVGVAMRAAPGAQSIIFTQLQPGRYAVIAFHDENDNGRLDESPWGVPTEGYGFSNDAQGFLTAPSFEAAGLTLGAGDGAITISLIYPRTAQGPAPAEELR
jgi:uncharacterized protein (DUF2141 family)